jgi:phosphoglycerate dehydrogenase-like enzyme
MLSSVTVPDRNDAERLARPAVLYLPMDGLDVSLGEDLLRGRGIDVLHLDQQPTPDQLDRVVAMLIGYDAGDAQLLDRLPALRLVATHSVGWDMVDPVEVRRRGLWLANVPDGATVEVASHALAMTLALVRRLPQFDRLVRQGGWDDQVPPLPRVPAELTCGVVGLGRIGRAFVAMAGGLFGRLVGYDPALPQQAWPAGVERCDAVDDLLRGADCVSLHLPLTPHTRHLLDSDRLALLPEGAVVVNVSRGELIDTAALARALASGRLGGAGCDVLPVEPPESSDPLLDCDDVLLSPHVAYLSAPALRRYVETPARNVLELLDTGHPLTPVISPEDPAESTAP